MAGREVCEDGLARENARLRHALEWVRGEYLSVLFGLHEDDYEGRTALGKVLGVINLALDNRVAQRMSEEARRAVIEMLIAELEEGRTR